MAVRQREAYRPSTRAAHASNIAAFIEFCLHQRLAYLPPSLLTLLIYFESLAQRLHTYASVINHVNSLKFFFRAIQVPCPLLQDPAVTKFLKALPKTMRNPSVRRQPLTIFQLITILTMCDRHGPDQHTYRLAYVVGFFCMLRRSNLAPNWPHQFDPLRHPVRADLLLTPNGLQLTQRWAKNLQEPSARKIFLPVLPGHVLDPVVLFEAMLIHSPTLSPTQPLFTLSDGTPLPASHLHDFLKDCVSEMGYSPAAYGLHSLRIGAASLSRALGCSTDEIQRHGLWKSNSVQLYLRDNLADKLAIPRAFASSLLTPFPQTV